MAVVTGTPSTTIVAQSAVSDPGQPITKDESKSTVQPILDDLATIRSGNCTIAGTKTFSGKAVLSARVIPRSARVVVADGNKRLGVTAGTSIDYSGKRFYLPTLNASPRAIILDHSNAPPGEAETIEVIWNPGAVFGTGTQFSFKREDATVIARFVGTGSPEVLVLYCWAEFEFVSGAWRLGASSGFAVDANPALFGVVPDVSA